MVALLPLSCALKAPWLFCGAVVAPGLLCGRSLNALLLLGGSLAVAGWSVVPLWSLSGLWGFSVVALLGDCSWLLCGCSWVDLCSEVPGLF